MADINSVYQLVTKLCEAQCEAQRKQVTTDTVKRLRSKVFDLLLFNRKFINDPFWLEDCNDYHCQFLAWQFILRNTYKQEKMAATLDTCVQTIMASSYDPHTINRILHVLLKLKRPPRTLSEIEFNPPGMTKIYRKFIPSDFHLAPPPSSLDVQFSTNSFDMQYSHSVFFAPDVDVDSEFGFLSARSSVTPYSNRSRSKTASSPSSMCEYADCIEPDSSRHKELSVWEMMSSMTFTKKRTWEALGNSTPAKEKPFLSEANACIYDAIEKLRVITESRYHIKSMSVLTRQEYMKDLKSLAVGIQSKTFIRCDDVFVINQHILFEGLSCAVFQQYAMLLINVGVCYKALEAMVADVLCKNDEHGCVYTEFHKAVNRYLTFYRAAAVNVDAHQGIIQYHAHIRKLSAHLFAVAAICKVGTFADPNYQPNHSGVDLLNILYRKVFTQVDKQVLLVLHALLFPCLQIYFLNYLNPWLLEGILNDPFEEFFIRKSDKYLASRGRTYWTRSFSICDDAIPEFCAEFAAKIFECGQITNLLRICAPKASIFQCHAAMTRTQRERFMQCCITEQQLRRMEMCIEGYELDVIAKIGASLFSLKRMFEYKRDEELVFNKFLAVRKASSIKRMQMNKIEKLTQDIDDDMEDNFANKKKQILIMENEAKNIIAFYDTLAKTANKFDEDITLHNETMKSIHLDEQVVKPPRPPRRISKIPCRIGTKPPVTMKDKPAEKKKLASRSRSSPRSNARKNKLKVNATEFESTTLSSYDPVYEHFGKRNRCKKQPVVKVDVGNQSNTSVSEVPAGPAVTMVTSMMEQPQLDTYISAPKFELVRLDSTNQIITLPSKSDTKIQQYYESFKSYGKSSLEDDDEHNATATPMRVTLDEVAKIPFPYLNAFISRSLQLPIQVQLALVKSELLKHFVLERDFLQHLTNLRSFYFLLDGGFAHVLCNCLFEHVNTSGTFEQKLLSEIIRYATEMCHKPLSRKQRLSLHFIHMPQSAMLGNVYALDCITLEYEIKWPLNILLPTKVIAKYDEIFKFMLKVHRVSWVLKKVLFDLKHCGRQSTLLTLSNHYHKIHLWRHILTHFVQSFYSYIVGEVFQSSWSAFQNNMVEIDDFDALYKSHGIYMRQNTFLCFLHQKTSPIRDIIMNLFDIFIKYHDYLRSREWKLHRGEFVHPNFLKMECIFNNFLALVKYFLKICKKIARAAYQPQFNKLIDMVDFNRYYSEFSNAL